MGLSNYQLVFLDNLIYLSSFTKYVGDKSDKDGNVAIDGVTIGTAVQNIIENKEGLDTCFMSQTEWIGILNAIKDDKMLCALKIHNLVENSSGFCGATWHSMLPCLQWIH